MKMKKELGIRFDALAPPIKEQIEQQGYLFDADRIVVFEAHRDRATHLLFSDLLTSSMYDKVLQQLFNKINAHVISKNNLPK